MVSSVVVSKAESVAESSTELKSSAKPSNRPTFSHEINGIRGLALTMVVAFHLFGQGRVSGGVDVFLVISAYLMTGSLARSIFSDNLSLVGRYARTFIRLTPAALVTIIGTVAVGMWILPHSRLEDLFSQASASATFRENVYLATAGMSYGAAGGDTSPFQHFWSLSVQAQFFLLWPLVAFLLLLFGRKLSPARRVRVFVALTVLVTVLSFAYAIHLVDVNQPVAYYSLPARLWEFGLGGLAYFWGRKIGRFSRLGGALGWLGVGLIFSSGFIINGRDLFPGPWTLWPVLGTLLVIFASDSGGARRVGLTRVLSSPPLKWLASLGYPLYLVHWPILVFYLGYRQYEGVGWKGALGVLLLSILLAEVLNRVVTGPTVAFANKYRQTRWGPTLTALAVACAIGIVGGGTAYAANQQSLRQKQELETIREGDQSRQETGSTDQYPGALALVDPNANAGPWESAPVPSVEIAYADSSMIGEVGCVTDTDSAELQICEDMPGPGARGLHEGAKKVILVGGSHDIQYYEALRGIADQEGWELLLIGRNGCRLSAPDDEHTLSDQCYEWNAKAIPEIERLRPDAVFTLGTVTSTGMGEASPERVYEGQIEAWRQLEAEGIPVIALRDNPRFTWRVPECLQIESDPDVCGVSRSLIYTEDLSVLHQNSPANVIPIDTADWFCDATRCEPTVGNVLVYRDQGHFTATYARSLVPLLKEALEEKAPFLFN